MDTHEFRVAANRKHRSRAQFRRRRDLVIAFMLGSAFTLLGAPEVLAFINSLWINLGKTF